MICDTAAAGYTAASAGDWSKRLSLTVKESHLYIYVYIYIIYIDYIYIDFIYVDYINAVFV